MARSDRQSRLVQTLRDHRHHRAADLAQQLGVSSRTIWRDMESLAAAGLPVTGTRGTGYRLAPAIMLPPLALDPLQFEALQLGLKVIAQEADPELKAAAERLARRLADLQPGGGEVEAAVRHRVVTPAFAGRLRVLLPRLRQAIRDRSRLALTEERAGNDLLHRTVRPLKLDFLGQFWTLTAWCELRQDFRVLRVDRLRDAEPGPGFVDEPGKTLSDYLRRFSEGPDGN